MKIQSSTLGGEVKYSGDALLPLALVGHDYRIRFSE